MNFLLAKNGEAKADILIPPEADRVIRFAAKELCSYLAQISRGDFCIREAQPGSIFPQKNILCLVGAEEDVNVSLTPSFKHGANDAFVINADATGVRIQGNNSRSILYGVYELLEKLGCHFIEPGTEVVPTLPCLDIAAMNLESTAEFPLRNIFRIQILKSKTAAFQGLEPEHHLPQIDWMAKRKLNHYVFYVDYYRYDLWEKHKHHILDALLDRGFDIEVTHHSIYYFCPPDETYDFGDWGSATYRSEHPDWYEDDQLKIELPDVQKLLEERYMTFVRRNPELSIIGLWPTDGGMVGGSEAYLKLWNKIARTLSREFPEKKLSILAYREILDPPKGIKPEPNLFCWYCPIESNYMYPMSEAGNDKYLEYMKGWIDLMSPGHVIAFEYYGWQSELTPFTEKMKADLEIYHELGLAGVYGWAGFTFNIMGTNFRWSRDLYAFSHFLWNPNQDLAPLEAEWAKGVFAAAAPQVQKFYQVLKQTHDREKQLGLLSQKPWISMELLHELQKILAEARSKAGTPEVKYRVDLLEQLVGRACAATIWREQPSGIYSCF